MVPHAHVLKKLVLLVLLIWPYVLLFRMNAVKDIRPYAPPDAAAAKGLDTAEQQAAAEQQAEISARQRRVVVLSVEYFMGHAGADMPCVHPSRRSWWQAIVKLPYKQAESMLRADLARAHSAVRYCIGIEPAGQAHTLAVLRLWRTLLEHARSQPDVEKDLKREIATVAEAGKGSGVQIAMGGQENDKSGGLPHDKEGSPPEFQSSGQAQVQSAQAWAQQELQAAAAVEAKRRAPIPAYYGDRPTATVLVAKPAVAGKAAPIVVARCQLLCDLEQLALRDLSAASADDARSGERRMQGAKARHPQRRLAEQGPQECINTDDPEEKFRLKMPLALLEAAFPGREVRAITLPPSCMAPPGTTVDVIVLMQEDRAGYQDTVEGPEGDIGYSYVRNYRNDHGDRCVGAACKLLSGFDGDRIAYHGGVLVPHERGRPFMIAMHGEHWHEKNRLYDLVFEAKLEIDAMWTGGANLYFPEAARDFFNDHRMVHGVDELVLRKKHTSAKRNSFCAFMYGHCDNDQVFDGYDPEISVRTALHDVLSATYKTSDALGKCRLNPAAVGKHYNSTAEYKDYGNFWQSSVDTYKNFKFVIAFEASFQDGYWSEKMINAILANSVPIYGGKRLKPGEEPWLARYINPKRFIYCGFDKHALYFDNRTGHGMADVEHQYTAHLKLRTDKGEDAGVQRTKRLLKRDLDECVEKVKRMDQDDALYLETLNAPLLPNNKVEGSIFDLRTTGLELKRALSLHHSYLVE